MPRIKKRKIEIVAYDKKWPQVFKKESGLIKKALGKELVEIHHIGSTSIPNMTAKPIVDMLAEVKSVSRLDTFNSAMKEIGYEAMGEFGIPRRRYFRKNIHGMRRFQIHAFRKGDSEIKRHLLFRDYMKTHPRAARVYSELKQKLAKKFHNDIESYMDGKDGFIKDIDEKAAKWKKL